MQSLFRALLLLFVCSAVCAASDAVPYLYQPLAPTAVAPGHGAFTMAVNGTGFVSGAVVRWNGSALSTTYVSRKQLKATVPAANVANSTTATITVVNPGETVASNPVLFPVRQPGGVTLGISNSDFVTLKFPEALVVGDLDGNGTLDMVVANWGQNAISTFLGNGDGTFQPRMDQLGIDRPWDIVLADFDGDGMPDILITDLPRSNEGSISVLRGLGNGQFSSATASATHAHPSCPAIADFNGDGRLDAALVYAGGGSKGFSILLGNGDGTFQPSEDFATDKILACPTVADFDGDGHLDLALANGGSVFRPPSGFNIFLGNGDGTFQPGYSVSTYTKGPSAIVVADFTGDGKLDLAVVEVPTIDGSGNVDVQAGDGTGKFQIRSVYGAGICPDSLAVGDFNGDGLLDIANNDPCSYAIGVESGQGHGRFAYRQYFTDLGGGGPIVATDLNGDGKIDFAVPEGSWGGNAIDVLFQQ